MSEDNNSGAFALNAVIGFLGLLLCVLLVALFARVVYPRIQPKKSGDNSELISDVIQLSVLNACGVPGMAAKVTASLRESGFDVINTGNFEHYDMEKTVVIARTFNKQNALRVAKALGVDPSQVIIEASENYYLDATVVIGDDYKTLNIN